MSEIHHLRASNHKKSVGLPSHTVSPTLVIRLGVGHNLEKILFCFIPQGALQTKAVIYTPPLQGAPGELPRFKTAVSPATTKVRSLEVWDGCPVFVDAPEKIPELEMITWYGLSVGHSFFPTGDSWLNSGAALQGTLQGDFTEGERVDRDKLRPSLHSCPGCPVTCSLGKLV